MSPGRPPPRATWNPRRLGENPSRPTARGSGRAVDRSWPMDHKPGARAGSASGAADILWGSTMAKSKTRTGKPAKSSRPAAEKSGSPKAPTEGPGQSEKLIQIQANKIILEALREVSVLLQDKMMDADRDIEALKKEREANKTF